MHLRGWGVGPDIGTGDSDPLLARKALEPLRSPAFASRCPRAVLALGLIAVFSSTAWSQSFRSPPTVTALNGPTSVVLADMDLDGIDDLVVTASEAGNVVIHDGNGDGSFRSPTTIAVGGEPIAVASADMDGNGQDDVVFVDRQFGRVGIIFSIGQQPTSYLTVMTIGEDEPESFVLRDMDGNQQLDVVVANRGADTISVFYNDQGTLSRPVNYGVGDGPARILDVSAGGQVRFLALQSGLLSNNAVIFDQSFTPLQVLPVASAASAVHTLWTDDGLLDLLITDGEGSSHVYAGQPGGSYAPELTWPIQPGASAVAALDNAGANRRALVVESDRHRVALYEGPATGPVDQREAYWVGAGVERLLLADADGDGDDEIFVPVADEGIVLVLSQTPTGVDAPRAAISGASPRQIESVEAAGGLPPRVAVLCANSGDIWFYEVINSSLTPVSTLDIAADAIRFRWGLIDADDLPDLAVLDPTRGIDIYLAQGAGFAFDQTIVVDGDLRDIELLVTGTGSRVDVLVADLDVTAVRRFSNDGDAVFQAASDVACSTAPALLETYDLDPDGRDDLIILGDLTAMCLAYNDPGGFNEITTLQVGDSPRGFTGGDFNADQRPDFAVGLPGEGTFSVLVSLFERSFAFAEQNRIAPSGSQIAAATDVNNDGTVDLVFGGPNSTSVSVHFNIGPASFAVATRTRCSSAPLDFLLHEVDGNNNPDLLVLDSLGDVVVTLLAPDPNQAPGDLPSAVTASDRTLVLAAPYPNPTAAGVTLRFQSPRAAAPLVRVLDIRGRRVANVTATAVGTDWYEARWTGQDQQGRRVAAGRYVMQVEAGGRRSSRSFILQHP